MWRRLYQWWTGRTVLAEPRNTSYARLIIDMPEKRLNSSTIVFVCDALHRIARSVIKHMPYARVVFIDKRRRGWQTFGIEITHVCTDIHDLMAEVTGREFAPELRDCGCKVSIN